MLWEEVDVVGDNHQVADSEGRVHASGGIGDIECADAELIHDAHGEGDLLHGVALIIVEASLHGQDVDASELAEDEFAGVSLDGGHGEVGYLTIGELRLVSYLGS